jgi:Tol biopolymer transport system component
MRIKTVFFVASLYVFGATPALAQNGHDLFQQGLVQEQAEGNLLDAIRLYTRVVTEYILDRPLVARALVQIGRAYDKLGDSAARTAYERIVAEFADQREALRIALERLRILDPDGRGGTTPPGADPRFTLLWNPQGLVRPEDVDYSPDGSRFVTVLPDSSESRTGLYMSDASGALHKVLVDRGLGNFRLPKWSPDGTHIVFEAVQRADGTAPQISGVFVMSEDGSDVRLISPDRRGFFTPLWTPSGNVTFMGPPSTYSLETVDLNGTMIRHVTRPECLTREEAARLIDERADPNSIRCVGLMENSPDGRWLVFRGGPPGDWGYWIMPATGGQARHLVEIEEGPSGLRMTWDNDGRAIYFVGLKGQGLDNVYRLDIDPRTGEAVGEPVAVTSYQGVEVWSPKMLASGGLAYVVTTTADLVQMVDDESRPTELRTLARGTKPQLSRDGSLVYYVGQGNGREGIFEIPSAGGEARRVTSLVPEDGYRLSPDGTEISLHTHNGYETSLFVVPVQGGEPRLVASFNSGSAHTPVWSPDGSRLAFAHDGDLFVVAARGGVPERIAQLDAWETYSIRWSPDGNHLAGFAKVKEESQRAMAVFAVPASGGELRRLTPPEEGTGKEGLSWHPDGERLSYHTYAPEGSRIAYLDGRPTTFLVDLPGRWDYVGFWTLDGKTYLFESYFMNNGSIVGGGYMAYDDATGRTSEFTLADWAALGWDRRLEKTTQVTRQIWMIEDFR